jgi:hypothetical protein
MREYEFPSIITRRLSYIIGSTRFGSFEIFDKSIVSRDGRTHSRHSAWIRREDILALLKDVIRKL